MNTFYVPFQDNDLIHGANHFYTDGPRTVVVRGVGTVDLSALGRSDTRVAKDVLYILAHGRYSSGSEIVGVVKGRVYGTRNATMNANTLANELIAARLPKTFGDIRLLVCWGGYIGGNEKSGGHTLKRKASEPPFAGQLCGALKTKGFSRMQVTGYRGMIAYVPEGRETYQSDAKTTLNSGAVISERLGRARSNALRPQSGNSIPAMTLDNDARTVWY